MRFLKGFYPTVVFFAVILSCGVASANDYYVAQSAAGAGDATSCANAKASSWSWTSPTVTDGDTVHLCGTLTSQLSIPMGGITTAVTVKFETGAKFSAAYFGVTGAIRIAGKNHLLIDGGTNGIIEDTGNGDGLVNRQVSTGIYLTGCTYIEIKNLTIKNIYVHTQNSSSDPGGSIESYGIADDGNVNVSIHDNVIHDVKYGLFRMASNAGSVLNWYSNTIYNTNWAFGVTAAGSGVVLDTVNVYSNDVTMGNAWDDTTGSNHHNGLYAFTDPSGAGQIRNLAIYNNYFHGAVGQVWTSTGCIFTSYGVPSPKIYNNLFIGVQGDPADAYIDLEYGVAASSPLVANNTFVGTSSTPYGLITPRCVTLANNVSTTATIKNNVCSTVAQGVLSTSGSSFTSDYNNVYNVTYYGVINSTYYSAWSGGGSWQTAGYDVHGSKANPLLSSTYTLTAGSAAIGLGSNLTTLGITTLNSDKNTVSRPSTGAWDAGAFSSGIILTPPSPPTGLAALAH